LKILKGCQTINKVGQFYLPTKSLDIAQSSRWKCWPCVMVQRLYRL